MAHRDEQRRIPRVPIEVPVEFTTRDSWDTMPGIAKDISLGGMFIETAHTVPVGIEIVVRIALPSQSERFSVPTTARWTSKSGMGVQFGLLGARETHAITEIEREHGSSPHGSR